MKFIFPLVMLGLSFTKLSAYAADASQVQSFTLKNGMKVLVLEDNSIPKRQQLFVLESWISQRSAWHYWDFAFFRAYDV